MAYLIAPFGPGSKRVAVKGIVLANPASLA
jgi:hypothetical protein